jgi:catechol 2,3-dioxygenase-like lactoylglutathione lyase family enzyme
MERSVAPMIHVPDVAATVAWYQSLDFTVVDRSEDDGELNWAMLAYGNAAVMFNAGGQPSYGMREFIVRDPNGFRVTFGEPAKE